MGGYHHSSQQTHLTSSQGQADVQSGRLYRPRPLDFDKKLAIVRDAVELDDLSKMRPVSSGHELLDAQNERVLTASTEQGDHVNISNIDESRELRSGAIDASRVNSVIPTPVVCRNDDYEMTYKEDFVPQESYSRYMQDENVPEYDLTDSDDEWLAKFNRKVVDRASMSYAEVGKPSIAYRSGWIPGEKVPDVKITCEDVAIPILTRRRLECMIDALEKESGKRDSILIQAEAINLLLRAFADSTGLRPREHLVNEIVRYWIQKRSKLGKPLLRRFRQPTSLADTNPHHCFRPREKFIRTTRSRVNRSNDPESFDRMREMRQEMIALRRLLALVHCREIVKRRKVESNFALLDARIIIASSSRESDIFMHDRAIDAIPLCGPDVIFVDSCETAEVCDPAERSLITSNDEGSVAMKGIVGDRIDQKSHGVNVDNAGQRKTIRRLPRDIVFSQPGDPVMYFTCEFPAEELGIFSPQAHGLRGRFGRGGRILLERQTK